MTLFRSSSINQTLKTSNMLLIFLTTLPIVIFTLFFSINIARYERMMSNVTQANLVLSQAPNRINMSLWYKISGKNGNGEDPITVITHYENQLSELRNRASTTELRQTALVASRILMTIERYSWQIDSNMNNNFPIEQSESILEQIYEVNDLFEDTLQEYVQTEISVAGEKSQEIKMTTILLIFFEVFVVLISLLFVRRFNTYLQSAINLPIQQISKMIKNVSKGQWTARVPAFNTLELNDVGEGLNKMTVQLSHLFNQNTQKQQNLAISEMKVLQAQITPHFIYNSLDAIVSLASTGETKKVQEITFALSNFFKLTLNKGSEWISVEKEVEHIKNYLDILSIRYGPLLTYSLDINPFLSNEIVLKMVLQPLVENAMYHGIKNSRRRGTIHISIQPYHQSRIQFRISDNGMGMTEETLSLIQTKFREIDQDYTVSNDEQGYGLFNVYRRLKLYFNDSGTLTIFSQIGKGTTILVTLPIKENGGESLNV